MPCARLGLSDERLRSIAAKAAKNPGKVFLTYDGGSGGYGYNYRYLAPLTVKSDGTETWTPVRPSSLYFMAAL